MKKGIYTIMLAVLLLCNTSLSAQQTIIDSYRNHFKTVDSLEQVLATNPPTGQDLLLVYRNLAYGNLGSDNQKVKLYSLKGIPLAQQLNFPRVEAFFHHWLGLTYYHESLYDSAKVCYNRALIAAEHMKTSKGSSGKPYPVENIDDKFASIYGDMGNLYKIQGKYHEAIEYYTKALEIYEKHAWKESIAIAYENIGEMYLSMENYEQAESNFAKLYAIGQEIKDSLIIMYADKELSALYLAQKIMIKR
jgi:tetratricopeptide (TPR) repeat protein